MFVDFTGTLRARRTFAFGEVRFLTLRYKVPQPVRSEPLLIRLYTHGQGLLPKLLLVELC